MSKPKLIVALLYAVFIFALAAVGDWDTGQIVLAQTFGAFVLARPAEALINLIFQVKDPMDEINLKLDKQNAMLQEILNNQNRVS